MRGQGQSPEPTEDRDNVRSPSELFYELLETTNVASTRERDAAYQTKPAYLDTNTISPIKTLQHVNWSL